MSRVHYFADGYLRDGENDIRQSAWACMYNPTSRDAKLDFTFYYEDCEPTYDTFAIPAHSSGNKHLAECNILKNKRFGAKIVTSEPMVIQITTGYYGLEDKHDWFTRAMHSVICADTLSKVAYYADGLVLDRPGARLKEPEWDFVLNPNKVPANVVLHAEYKDQTEQQFKFTIGAERLLAFFKDPAVVQNKCFGGKYVSDVPVAVQQTRLIEEEDRFTIRSCFSVMAKPAPLLWNDESQPE
jgi:hypothetical protein